MDAIVDIMRRSGSCADAAANVGSRLPFHNIVLLGDSYAAGNGAQYCYAEDGITLEDNTPIRDPDESPDLIKDFGTSFTLRSSCNDSLLTDGEASTLGNTAWSWTVRVHAFYATYDIQQPAVGYFIAYHVKMASLKSSRDRIDCTK